MQSLRAGTVAQMLPLAAGYGVNFLATPYFVAVLGLTQFGIWSVTGALAQYAALLDLGVSRAVTRFVALHHAQGDRSRERAVTGGALTVVAVLTLVLAAAAVFAAPLFESVLHTGSNETARLLLVAAIVILVAGMAARIIAAAAFGRGRMVAGNVGLAVQTSLIVIGGVIALWIEPTLDVFAAGNAAGALIGLIAVITAVLIDEREFALRIPNATVMRELLSFGIKGQTLGIADIVMFQSPKLILGFVVGPAAAGAFELASRLAVGARAFGAAASVALTAHMTRAFAAGGDKAVRDEYLPLVRTNCGVSIFAPFLLVATSLSLVPLWLGSPHSDVRNAVIVLAVAFTFNVTTGVTTAAILAIDRLGMLIKQAFLSCALALGLAIPAGIWFGFDGVTAATAAAVIIGAAVSVVLLQRAMGIPVMEYVTNIVPGYVASVVALAPALLVGVLADPQNRRDAIVPFVLSTLVFCSVYVVVGWRLGTLPKLPNRGAGNSPVVDTDRQSD